MKKTLNILLIGLAVTVISCDVLNQEPEDLISTEDAIVDRQSANAALTGLYDLMQDGDYYGGRYIMATEMLSGNAEAAAFQQFWQELASGRVPSSNFHAEDYYIAGYAIVNAANAIIEQVPDVAELSDSEKNEILGSAYFIRGLSFFDLLRQFGYFYQMDAPYGIALPLEVADDASETARSSVAQSYAQVESDLNQAINLLPASSSKIFASKGAAQALLARVYLYEEKFTEASALASEVIASSNYALNNNYNDIYLSAGTAESIFELNFIQLEDPNAWATEMYIAPPEVAVTEELFDFVTGQEDRGIYFDQPNVNYRCTKYGTNRDEDGGNTIILRLSEMYLIRAEADGRTTNPSAALDDINIIRTRAGLDPLTPADLTDVLLNERRGEFAFEGHYWFDLIRYNLMEDELGLEAFRRVLPIPQREMNITDGTLIQNPGY